MADKELVEVSEVAVQEEHAGEYEPVSSTGPVNGEPEVQERASAALFISPAERAAAAKANNSATGTRYDHYVARYEVVAQLREVEQLEDSRTQTQSSGRRPMSIHIPPPLGKPVPTVHTLPATVFSISTTSVSSESATAVSTTSPTSNNVVCPAADSSSNTGAAAPRLQLFVALLCLVCASYHSAALSAAHSPYLHRLCDRHDHSG